uniref:Pentatricopeptide repeat-containing protein At2g35130-like n=1 Tax=Rhizophora mucronata TaxID=61149 RepID=A0A2P2L2Z1_RHIMU
MNRHRPEDFFPFSPNRRAGFPYGSAEIFSLMQHMGCEPDRASYNIMVDAYGRAGLHKGKIFKSINACFIIFCFCCGISVQVN